MKSALFTSRVHTPKMASLLVFTYTLAMTTFITAAFSVASSPTSSSSSSSSSTTTATATTLGGAAALAVKLFSEPRGPPPLTGSRGQSFARAPRRKMYKSDAATLEMINKQLAKVVDPIAMALGIAGNALLVLAFLVTPLRLRPHSHVMAGLGVVDLMYTLSCMLVYLPSKGVNVYHVPGACQVMAFTLSFSKSVQAWYIFISHFNRLSAHTNSGYERRRWQILSIKFALVMVAILVATPLVHVLWSMETRKLPMATFCMPMRETIYVHLILRKIEVVAATFLPLTLTAGVDVMLIFKLVVHIAFKSQEVDDRSTDHTSSTSSTHKPRQIPLQEPSAQNHVTEPGHNHQSARTSIILEQAASVSESSCLHVQELSQPLRENPAAISDSNQSEILNSRSRDTDAVLNSESLNQPLPASTSMSSFTYHLATFPTSTSHDFPKSFHHQNKQYPSSQIITNNLADPVSSRPTGHNQASHVNSVGAKRESSRTGDAITNDDSRDAGSKEKSYNIMSLVFSLLQMSRCRKNSHVGVNFHEDIYVSTPHSPCQKNLSTGSPTASLSVSQGQPVPEDQDFPNDLTSCTVTTIIMGLTFALMILPTTFTQAAKLFLSSHAGRPNAYAIQQAILFESLVKLNAVYKFVMYAVMMPSFRHAILWLLTHWIPSKLPRMSTLCLWGSAKDKSEAVYV